MTTARRARSMAVREPDPVAAFIDRYSPTVAANFRAARTALRKRFRRGYELVYDNYNGLGCGYSISPKGSGVVVSIVAYPRWVTLFLFHGAGLADPEGLLGGKGSRIRSVRLDPFSRLKSPALRALLDEAIAPFEERLAIAPRLSTLVKAAAVKRRPRRS